MGKNIPSFQRVYELSLRSKTVQANILHRMEEDMCVTRVLCFPLYPGRGTLETLVADLSS